MQHTQNQIPVPVTPQPEHCAMMNHNPSPHRHAVVQVLFPGEGVSCSYYNDRFDLQVGDLVYVEGKMAGHRGRVTSVNFNFRIKLADYKRVTAVIDTRVCGNLFILPGNLISFDRSMMPVQQVRSWFLEPADEADFISGSDGSSVDLDDLSPLDFSSAITERGQRYFRDRLVRYFCLDGDQGYAIVAGGENYEVFFRYADHRIRDLSCSCFCNYHCKHEYAVLLQLRELLAQIQRYYSGAYERSGYFAAINQDVFFDIAVKNKTSGSLNLR